MRPNWIALGAFSAGSAVLLGAFGSHGLRNRISEGDFELWKTAVLYQAIHALGLVAFGLFLRMRRNDGSTSSPVAGWAFVAGSLLFCGPLYAHALGSPEAILHLAPVGGLSFVVGWIAFGVSSLRGG